MPLTMLLQSKLNISVGKALNGAQAIEEFVNNRNQSSDCNCGKGYRLILMDINMPVMDGCTATKHILEFQKEYVSNLEEENREKVAMGQETTKILPLNIVAITSYTNKDNVDECFNVGMKDVIHKPVNFNHLVDVLKKYYYTEKELETEKHKFPAGE